MEKVIQLYPNTKHQFVKQVNNPEQQQCKPMNNQSSAVYVPSTLVPTAETENIAIENQRANPYKC